MLEDERYWIDILTQIGAVTNALESVALKLLHEHVTHGKELLAAVHRFARTR